MKSTDTESASQRQLREQDWKLAGFNSRAQMSHEEFWTDSFCQCSIAAVWARPTASGKENAPISENKAARWEQNECKDHDHGVASASAFTLIQQHIWRTTTNQRRYVKETQGIKEIAHFYLFYFALLNVMSYWTLHGHFIAVSLQHFNVHFYTEVYLLNCPVLFTLFLQSSFFHLGYF